MADTFNYHIKFTTNQTTGNSDEKPKLKEETGNHDIDEYIIKEYPFDKYCVRIKLTQNNEFAGIEEIKINKKFLSDKQKTIPSGFHDIEEFYRD